MARIGKFIGSLQITRRRNYPNLFNTPSQTTPDQPSPIQQSTTANSNTSVNGTGDKNNADVQKRVLQQQRQNPNEPIVVTKEGEGQKVTTAEQASTELLRIKGVWPFDFFPNELIVEEKRIVINDRFFAWSNKVSTMLIKDIAIVEISQSILFASLHFIDAYGDSSLLQWLTIPDAKRAKEIIDGLIVKEKSNMTIETRDVMLRQKALRQLGTIAVTT